VEEINLWDQCVDFLSKRIFVPEHHICPLSQLFVENFQIYLFLMNFQFEIDIPFTLRVFVENRFFFQNPFFWQRKLVLIFSSEEIFFKTKDSEHRASVGKWASISNERVIQEYLEHWRLICSTKPSIFEWILKFKSRAKEKAKKKKNEFFWEKNHGFFFI